MCTSSFPIPSYLSDMVSHTHCPISDLISTSHSAALNITTGRCLPILMPWEHFATDTLWLAMPLEFFPSIRLQVAPRLHHCSHIYPPFFAVISHWIFSGKFTPNPPYSSPSALHICTLCFYTFPHRWPLSRSQFTHSASVVHCLHLRLSLDVPYGSVPISKSAPSAPSLPPSSVRIFSRVESCSGRQWRIFVNARALALARLAPTQRARGEGLWYAFQFSVSNPIKNKIKSAR